MSFNFGSLGKVVGDMMYGDKCTITRLKTGTNKYGASKPDGRDEVYKDIRCKFSFSSEDAPADANDVFVPVLKKVTVFTDLEFDIKAGDFISGYREDPISKVKQLIEGICGEPNRYDMNQEIPIQLEKEN